MATLTKTFLFTLFLASLYSCGGSSGGGGGGNGGETRRVFNSQFDPCLVQGVCTNIQEVSVDEALSVVQNSDFMLDPLNGDQTIKTKEIADKIYDIDPQTGQISSTDCDVRYTEIRTVLRVTDSEIYVKEEKLDIEVKPADICNDILADYPNLLVAKETKLNLDSINTSNVKIHTLLLNGEPSIKFVLSAEEVVEGEKYTEDVMEFIVLSESYFSATAVSHSIIDGPVFGKQEVLEIFEEVSEGNDTSDIDLDDMIDSDSIEDRT